MINASNHVFIIDNEMLQKHVASFIFYPGFFLDQQ